MKHSTKVPSQRNGLRSGSKFGDGHFRDRARVIIDDMLISRYHWLGIFVRELRFKAGDGVRGRLLAGQLHNLRARNERKTGVDKRLMVVITLY